MRCLRSLHTRPGHLVSLLLVALSMGAEGALAQVGPDFATLLGGKDTEQSLAIARGAGGLVFLVGYTKSPSFLGQPALGAKDGFVVCLDPSKCKGAALLWAVRMGGSGDDVALDVAVAGTGSAARVTVVGSTASTSFSPTPTANAFQSKIGSSGYPDGFIVQLDLQGKPVYSTYFGGAFIDRIGAVAVDPTTKLVTVAGYSTSPNWALKGFVGGADAFVARLDLNRSGSGALVAGRMFGGSSAEGFVNSTSPLNWDLIDLHVDARGVATIAGTTASRNFPCVNAFQSRFGGFRDIFVTRFDAGLKAPTWSTYLGLQGEEAALALAVERSGSVVVGGLAAAQSVSTPGCFQASYGGLRDGLIAKLDPSQTPQLVYATHIGGGGQDYIADLAVEDSGIITACGPTWSPVPPVFRGTPGAWIRGYPGTGSGFVLRLEPAGRGSQDLQYLSFIGPGNVKASYESCSGLALTDNGRAVLACESDNSKFPTKCAPQSAYGGGASDAGVVVLDMLPTPVQRLGASSPACRPTIYSQVGSQPSAGNQLFEIHCNQAPASAAGGLVLGTGRFPRPVPIFGANLFVVPNFFVPALAGANGFARQPLPVPIGLPMPLGISTQWLWVVTQPCNGERIAGSDVLGL